MTVAATLTAQQFVGNGSATQFSFNNKIFQASDLVVTLFDLSGNQYSFPGQANAQLGLTYTVQNVDVDTGCLVVFSGPPALNWTIDVRTQTPQTQSTSIKNQGAFLPELHEEAFDRLTRTLQDVFRQGVQYSIRAPDLESVPWPAMPSIAARKGLQAMFDPVTGLPTVGTPTSTVVTGGLIASLLGILGKGITQAETIAGVTPVDLTYAPYNIMRYGADPTGVTPSDTALANAIAVCGTAGGTIRIPAGVYTFASPINLNGKSSIIIQGDGGCTGGAATATLLEYAGTGSGVWITMFASVGCWFRDVQLAQTNAGFTGTYIKCGNSLLIGGANADPPFCGVSNCVIGSSLSPTGNVHLDLDKCINFTAIGCNFLGGNPSVKGMASGSYSNVIRFQSCEWPLGSNISGPIVSQGQAWTFSGCTFEALTNGGAGGISGAAAGTNPCVGLVIEGCWFGDVGNGTAVGAWIDGCLSAAIIAGNYFSGFSNTDNTSGINLRQSSGVTIIGNSFGSMLNAINFAVGNCFGIVCKGNTANGVGNLYVNPSNVPLGQLDFAIGFGFLIPSGHGSLGTTGYRVRPDGSIEQWGTASVTTSTGTATPFPVSFPNACFNVEATLSNVGSTANTIYISSPTTTGFTYTIGGTFTSPTTFFWRAIGN